MLVLADYGPNNHMLALDDYGPNNHMLALDDYGPNNHMLGAPGGYFLETIHRKLPFYQVGCSRWVFVRNHPQKMALLSSRVLPVGIF